VKLAPLPPDPEKICPIRAITRTSPVETAKILLRLKLEEKTITENTKKPANLVNSLPDYATAWAVCSSLASHLNRPFTGAYKQAGLRLLELRAKEAGVSEYAVSLIKVGASEKMTRLFEPASKRVDPRAVGKKGKKVRGSTPNTSSHTRTCSTPATSPQCPPAEFSSDEEAPPPCTKRYKQSAAFSSEAPAPKRYK
jgi:hypothetical protein